MPVPSPLGESVRETLDAFPGVTEHPAGHSQYLLRYKAPGGASFAVQRVEINSVRFWTLENETFADCAVKAGLVATLHTPASKGKPGRNSNLDQIPEFKGRPLHWVPVANAAQAVSLVGLLSASTAKAPEPRPDPVPEPVREPAAEAVPETAPPQPPAREPAVEPPAPEPHPEPPPVEVPPMQTHAEPAQPDRPGPHHSPAQPGRRPGLIRRLLSLILRRGRTG